MRLTVIKYRLAPGRFNPVPLRTHGGRDPGGSRGAWSGH